MISSIEELAERLHELPDFIEERVAQILKTNADLMQGLAQVFAPVKTGYLRDHIEVLDISPLEKQVVSGAPYSMYVEARTPYMAPAAAQVEPQLTEQLKALQQEIDDFINR